MEKEELIAKCRELYFQELASTPSKKAGIRAWSKIIDFIIDIERKGLYNKKNRD